MEIGTTAVAEGQLARPSRGLRTASVIAALALVFAVFVLVQDRADASPGPASVAAAVAVPAAVAGVAPQIDIRQIVCPIVIRVRNSFSRSPFFAIVARALNPVLIRFGCGVS